VVASLLLRAVSAFQAVQLANVATTLPALLGYRGDRKDLLTEPSLQDCLLAAMI
jgi:hypothetical protein